MFYFTPHAHWLLRLMVSAVFFYHGSGKLMHLKTFASMSGLPLFIALLVGLFEFIGAGLLIAGGVSKSWVTRLGTLPLIVVMLGAIFKVHWGQWGVSPSQTHPAGGIEFPLTLLVICVYLFLKGNKR